MSSCARAVYISRIIIDYRMFPTVDETVGITRKVYIQYFEFQQGTNILLAQTLTSTILECKIWVQCWKTHNDKSKITTFTHPAAAGRYRCSSKVPGGPSYVRNMRGRPWTVDSWLKLVDAWLPTRKPALLLFPSWNHVRKSYFARRDTLYCTWDKVGEFWAFRANICVYDWLFYRGVFIWQEFYCTEYSVYTETPHWYRGITSRTLILFDCCRRFDFTVYLHNQCLLSGVTYPEYGRRILAVSSFYKIEYLRVPITTPMKNGIVVMLQRFGLSFDGNHHSALDDASNLARIVVRMVQDGHRSKMNANIYGHLYRTFATCTSRHAKVMCPRRFVDWTKWMHSVNLL